MRRGWTPPISSRSKRRSRRGGRQKKDAARRALEAQARPVTSFIQGFPKTTDADRATIGITIRAAGGGATPAPSSRPLVVVESAGRYTHELRLVDESTPTRRARPRGVERAEVFVAFTPTGTPAPNDFNAFRYVQSVSDGSTVLSYESPQGGMEAHSLARRVTRRSVYGAVERDQQRDGGGVRSATLLLASARVSERALRTLGRVRAVFSARESAPAARSAALKCLLAQR
jgi:hypothetical protein